MSWIAALGTFYGSGAAFLTIRHLARTARSHLSHSEAAKQ